MADQAGRGPDPYHVPGITAGASGADIARADRQLARGLHPGARPAGPDAADPFRAVCDAYALLSDPARRAARGQRHAPPRCHPAGWRGRARRFGPGRCTSSRPPLPLRPAATRASSG